MSIEIQQAEKKNLQEVLELQKSCFQIQAKIYDDYKLPPLIETLEDMERLFEGTLFLKAVENDCIIGSVRARIDDGNCYIGRLIVHPDFQDRGLGTELMVAIESEFNYAEKFKLFTGHKSMKNQYLYKKLNYIESKRELLKSGVELIYYIKENSNNR